VTYDDNDATSAHSGGDETYMTGTAFALPTPPSRTGHTFAGWRLTGAHATTSNIGAAATDATPSGYGNVTLTAQWATDLNTVTYDDNGASSAHSGGDETYVTGSSFDLPTAPVRSGYTFTGWQLTGVNATTASISSSAPSATPVGFGDITLTAQWSANSYTVTYDTQGGTTVSSGTYTWGNSVTLASAPTRSGYTFTGWFVASSGGSALGATYTPGTPGNLIIYAQWSALTYRVDYDPNGGTGTIASDTYISGDPALQLANSSPFTRTGYTFVSWNTSGDGTGTKYAARASVTPTSDMTLYAMWKPSADSSGTTSNPTTPTTTTPTPGDPPTPKPSPTPEPSVTPSGRPLAQPDAPSTGTSILTIDVGDGINTQSENQTVLQSVMTSQTSSRSLSEMRDESVDGFTEGSSVIVRVSGARTTGQFVVSTSKTIDTAAVAAALEESISRQATGFAQLTSAKAQSTVDLSKVTTGMVSTDARDLFTASGLGAPRTLGSLPTKSATHWVDVQGTARGYVPGSVVYLAVTTSPIIFGSAQVDSDGNAVLDGLLPIDVLEPAAHSIRIVGTRDFGGVTVAPDGKLQLSDTAMSEIESFDQGTNAIVEMVGPGAQGDHIAVRLIPLLQIVPWWVLWIYLGALALFFALRRWKADSKAAFVALWTVALGGMVAVEIVAWVELAYPMLPYAPIAVALVAGLDALLSMLTRIRRRVTRANVPNNVTYIGGAAPSSESGKKRRSGIFATFH
jgi:uncharacterized repeat protein (TIGR02543 family)